MKRGVMLGLAIAFAASRIATAGTLQDLYRSGGLRLSADPDYGTAMDWQSVFSGYSLELYGKPAGARNELAVAPDGSVFVSSYAQYQILKFDPAGKLVSTFGSKGNGAAQFRGRPEIGRIAGGRYLPVSEYATGRVLLFDLQGRFVKTIKVDYPIMGCVSLPKDRLAIFGLILRGEREPKVRIAIMDLTTEKEKEVRSAVGTPRAGTATAWRLRRPPAEPVRSAGRDALVVVSPPFGRVQGFLGGTSRGELVVGFSNSPELTVHSADGGLIRRVALQITPLAISERQKQEYLAAVRVQFASRDASRSTGRELPEYVLEEMKAPSFFPAQLPYYYNLMVDPEDNILVFVYTEDGPSHRFRVYGPDGAYVCDSTIDADGFDLNLNPHLQVLEFLGSRLFGLLPLKKAAGVPLRLFRVDLAAQQKP